MEVLAQGSRLAVFGAVPLTPTAVYAIVAAIGKKIAFGLLAPNAKESRLLCGLLGSRKQRVDICTNKMDGVQRTRNAEAAKAAVRRRRALHFIFFCWC